MALEIGFLIFFHMQQLDLSGPYDILGALPNATVHLLAKTLDPVEVMGGGRLMPDITFADSPQLDVLCIPGGPGVINIMEDKETLHFIRRQAPGVRYLTSVCTGSLVLGAAALLRGKKATTHWLSHDMLAPLGAIPVQERVVEDGKLITSAGVTSGIDLGLVVAGRLAGEKVGEVVELLMEYVPEPPFPGAGSPLTAPKDVVALVKQKTAMVIAKRREVVERCAKKVSQGLPCK